MSDDVRVPELANECVIRGTSLKYIRETMGNDLVDQALAAGIVQVV